MNIQQIAQSVTGGRIDALPKVDHQLFDFGEYADEAGKAIDGEDFTDLEWMMGREIAFNEFCEWQGRNWRLREDEDFGNWCAVNAPHALSWKERN